MAEIEDVRTFAREYISNLSARTPERKAKIKNAILNLTGRKLDNGCGTCYIEALYTILNFSNMASSKYVVKRGVVLQPFGHPEMSCDCNSITDEKGDWIMANNPELLIYFDKYPTPVERVKTPGITVIPPTPLSVDPIAAMASAANVSMPGNSTVQKSKPSAKTSRKKH